MACARSSGPHSGHPSAPANPQGGPPDPPSCSRRVLAWAPLHVPDCSEGSAQTGPWLPGQSSPGSQETPLWSAGAAARGPETLGGRWRPVTCLPGGGGVGLCSLGNRDHHPDSIHHWLWSGSTAGGPRRVTERPPPWAAGWVTGGTDGGSDGRLPLSPSGGPRSRRCWPGSGRRLSCCAPAGCTLLPVSVNPGGVPTAGPRPLPLPSQRGQDCSL